MLAGSAQRANSARRHIFPSPSPSLLCGTFNKPPFRPSRNPFFHFMRKDRQACRRHAQEVSPWPRPTRPEPAFREAGRVNVEMLPARVQNEKLPIGNKRTQNPVGASCRQSFRFHQPDALPRLLVFSKRIRHIMTQGDPICLLQQILHGRPEK